MKKSVLCLFVLPLLAVLSIVPTCFSLLPSAHAQNSPRYRFTERGSYRPGIPSPDTILGYEPGDRHSTFRDQERVILAIAAAAKDRVRVLDYGTSVEGRPLRLVIVSSPENMAKLDAIRADIGRLADPRTLTQTEEARILRETPVLTWINHCIHGNESASFETAMWTLYTLAASNAPAILDALRHSVVILNPVFNPDGHERFVVFYNSVAVGSPERFAYEKSEPWAIFGRFNHYRFDMNRDKLAQSQPETRQETAAFLKWHPQVFVDQHGQPETYFFPPNALPQNRQVDRDRLNKWTGVFGKANAAAFDRYGWQYVNRETFDLFYPGYLDSFTTLSGAIGMTYETDGGGSLARRRRDETISTLRDATAHHFETALATLTAAAANRESLLRDYLAYRRDAITAGQTDRMRRIVLLPGSDPGRLAELAALLLRVGIEVQEVRAGFTSEKAHAYLEPAAGASPAAKSRAFPAGSLVIDFAQPQGRVARAFLEPDADFEPEFVKEQIRRREQNEKKNENERKEGYEFYDITGWALPYTYGIEAYWTEDTPTVRTRSLTMDAQGNTALTGTGGSVQSGRATVAYLFPYDRDAAAFLALRLLQENYRLTVITKPLKVAGRTWERGTLIAFINRNPKSLHARIETLAKSLNVTVTAVSTGQGDENSPGLGSSYVETLHKPRVAVLADDMVSTTSYGAVWHLFERQAGLAFTPLRVSALRTADLSRFNVIVVPEGFGIGSALGKPTLDALKEWIRRGNVLIGMGSGGVWFTEKEVGISSATVVGSDVPSAEAVPAPPKTDAKPGEKPAEKPKPKKPVSIPGAIFLAKVDTTHFLGYGYPSGEITVPVEGATFLKPSRQGSNVVTFGAGPSRLSGFVWENNTEELLANTAYVLDEPLGAGHAILYLHDPTYRGLWLGLRRLFLSSILFAPTRTPLELPGE